MLDLSLRKADDPILRAKAERIKDINDPSVQKTIVRLLGIFKKDKHAVGAAAPQFGQSIRLFVMASHPTPWYPDAPTLEKTLVINPRIRAYSPQIGILWEGCLSLPDQRARVRRPMWVDVSYQSPDGKGVQRRFEGFLARIFQHEFDHLEGILFTDRRSSPIITNAECLRLRRLSD